jgi:uncharacterized lipoprotein YajG
VEAQVGIGFRVPKGKAGPGKDVIGNDCQKLAGVQQSILSFAVGGNLEACPEAALPTFQVESPVGIKYYRTWRVTASRNGAFQTSSSKFSAPNVEIANVVTNALGSTDKSAFVAAKEIKVLPRATISGRTEIELGDKK